MNLHEKLSPHFALSEFVISPTATRMGFDNTPSQIQINNLKGLCLSILEPLRNHYSLPLVVAAGYRCPQLNTLVGGSLTSQHVRGEACDFHIPTIELKNIFEYVVLHSFLVYNQIIYEFPPDGWIHIAFNSNRPNKMRNTVAKKDENENTIYTDYSKIDVEMTKYE